MGPPNVVVAPKPTSSISTIGTIAVELIGGGRDGLISPAGSAMEQGLHQAATGGTQEMGGNQLGGPGEITATTGNDHQLAVAWQKD